MAAPTAVLHEVAYAVFDRDLIPFLALCAIGLLITINVLLRFPDFGALIERYNHF